MRDDLSLFIPHVFESLFIEYESLSKKKVVLGVIYRPNTAPWADIDIFSKSMIDIMDNINSEHRNCIIMGDMNIDILKYSKHEKTNDYVDNLFACGFMPVITKPTRVTDHSATLIDHIYINNIGQKGHSGIVVTDVSDHFGTFYIDNEDQATQRTKETYFKRYYSQKKCK